MNAMTKTSKSGGCGCGGSSKSGGCGCGSGAQAVLCGCGDVGCATCRNQGFVRPRFFAGQLLTEEDLQKMIDYVVAKNRLHNQRLWGDGVVCGLEVSCHPCGGGTVVVKPGYALDCCGNDLVLTCPQPLDINAMVRELKRTLRGGHDCGEPCPPPKKKTEEPKNQLAGAGGTSAETGTATDAATGSNIRLRPGTTAAAEGEEEEPKDTTRHYCLYIRYCENLTDPVSPYATDEGCSYQSCQATRVSEGVSFELRCQEDCGHVPDIRDRICECIGDFESAMQMTRYSNSFYAGANLIMRVPDVDTANRVSAARNFVNSAKALQGIRIPPPSGGSTSKTGQPPLGGITETTTIDPKNQIPVEQFEGWLFDIHTADAHLASYYLAARLPGQQGEKEGTPDEQVGAALNDLRQAAEQLNARVNDVPAPEIARSFYSAALKHTMDLAAPQPVLAEPRLQEIARGQLLVRADLQSTITAMAAMKEGLLDRLDRSLPMTDCQLRVEVEAIRMPILHDPPTEIEQRAWFDTYRTLYTLWGRLLKDCICAAFNPPCAPCDDPAVLLACITVKDCEVVEICNLKRKFVISGPALRYWLPPLNWLGEKLEKLCCPDFICPEDEASTMNTSSRTVLGPRGVYGFAGKQPGRINFSILEILCGSRRKQVAFSPYGFASFGQVIAGGKRIVDSLRDQGATGFQQGPLGQALFGYRGGVNDIAAVIEKSDFAKLAVDALKANPLAGAALAEMAKEKVADAVTELRTSAAKDLKDVKRIKTDNAELKKIIKEQGDRAKELMDRVQKLEKGTPQ